MNERSARLCRVQQFCGSEIIWSHKTDFAAVTYVTQRSHSFLWIQNPCPILSSDRRENTANLCNIWEDWNEDSWKYKLQKIFFSVFQSFRVCFYSFLKSQKLKSLRAKWIQIQLHSQQTIFPFHTASLWSDFEWLFFPWICFAVS